MSRPGFVAVGGAGVVECRSGARPVCRSGLRQVSGRRLRVVRLCLAEESAVQGEINGEEPDEIVLEEDEEIVMESEASVRRRMVLAATLGLLNLCHLVVSMIAMSPLTFDEFQRGTIERGILRFWGAFGMLRISYLIGLKNAAENNRMESGTYKRMSVVFAFASLFAFWATYSSGMQTFPLFLSVIHFLNLSSGIVGGAYWYTTPDTGFSPLIGGTMIAVAEILDAKKITSMAYGLLAILSTLVFFAGAVNPASFLSVVYAAEPTKMALTAMRLFISGFALQAVALATLKDASERDRLPASTFKILNTGVCYSSVLLYVASLIALKGKPTVGAILFAAVNIMTAVISTYRFIVLRTRESKKLSKN
ncbi:hypothetical protein NDN08_001119 [Rhodosorus marinus]|uniref:Sugar phosphate transporter domain-containing protein n=1 Tax=Rhodosorus marinus TaxID=101924 RepID=A0AAV8UVL6_9RHOD|nr:hypothetical protein NDN08_001119 [Rhodosorus marinus]